MKPQQILGRATTPDGAEMVLYRRDGDYQIRLDGLEVMSSRAFGSEVELARQALAELAGGRPRVLIGGLGLGYTLRAALDALPAGARVTVAEILPEVVEWNRGELGELAGRPLDDPRVRVEVADVAVASHGTGGPFDAILLDVDNGPSAPLLVDNLRLYDHAGLTRLRDALAPGGVLAVWSAYAEPGFVRALGKAGFEARSRRVSARPGRKGPHHALFLAHRSERSERPRPRRRRN